MDMHPITGNPLRLASVTIQAVDRLGTAASEEIERAADEVLRGATEIAEKLRELAEAIRGQSRIAHEHIADFCEKATSVLEGIRKLHARFDVDQVQGGRRHPPHGYVHRPGFLDEEAARTER